MTSVEERLKLKRGQVDPWSTREKLCLASSVVKNGNQNWMSVSRSLRGFGGEPGRPSDWFSQKSCAVQYDNLLTQIETPKRKKRGADGSKSEGAELTPAQAIVKQLTVERIEELRKLMSEAREIYMREKEDVFLVQNGSVDDKLDEMMTQIQEDKRIEEAKQEEDQRMYKQREERKHETAWRPHAAQQHLRGPRRASSQSELGSETDNVESPSSSDQLTASEETAESKPASTPTSPLLTSLLKSPSPVTGSQSSILHSAITSQRGASPTITSLLNSSPGVPSSNSSIPQSPNLKSLVSSTLAGHDDVPKPQSHSASSSPTLSMLLELPPSTPGKLPELPYSATKQPTNTPKLGDEKEDPVFEHLPEVQCPELQPAAELVLEVGFSKQYLPNVEAVKKIDNCQIIDLDLAVGVAEPESDVPKSSEWYQSSLDVRIEEAALELPEQCCPTEKSFLESDRSLAVGLCDPNVELNRNEKFVEPLSKEDKCSSLEVGLSVVSTLEVDDCLLLEQCHSAMGSLLQVDYSRSPEQSTESPKARTEKRVIEVEDSEHTDKSINEGLLKSSQQISCEPVKQGNINLHLQRMNSSAPGPSQLSVVSLLSENLVTHSPCEVEEFSQKSGLESQEQCKIAVNLAPPEHKLESELPEQVQLSVAMPTIQLEPSNLESKGNPACITLKSVAPSPEVLPHVEQLGGGFVQEPDPAQGTELTIKQFVTICSGVNAQNSVDSVKKEPVPDFSNMEVILPVETDTKVTEPESKVNLDATDIQQISTDELEYVVDPSINVVLQEFVPEGLEDEMSVYIVNSDDVDTDVNGMLEAAESADTSEQTGGNFDADMNRDSSEVPTEEKGVNKGESEPDSAVVNTSPMHQSPQRTSATPSSVVASPRSAGRPCKGNMVARKLVMEEEEAAEKSELGSAAEATQHMVEDSDTLSREALENASVLLVQENGQLVNLSESGQATSIIDNIHVIQDSSNSGVVVVHHDNILKDTELDSNESSQSAPEDILGSNVNIVKEGPGAMGLETVSQDLDSKSPCKSPRKPSEKKEYIDACPVEKIEDSKYKEESRQNIIIDNMSIQGDSEEVSQSIEEIKVKDSMAQEEAVSNVKETKEEKTTQKFESLYDITSEDSGTKEDVSEDSSKYFERQPNEKTASKNKTVPLTVSSAEDEESQSVDSEVVATRSVDEKVNRAETPSTEDDNTRDVEPPPPPKRGRGRLLRESASYPDSVPNSPASSSVGHDDEKEHKAWKKSIMLVYNRISAHKNASIFLRPITDDKVPGYSSIIHRPQDLQTIKKNIEDKKIRTTDEFQRDILLMFNNAIMYNITDTPYHNMAREMQEEGVAHLNEYKNTQMLVNTGGAEISHPSSRRGTRTADKRDQDVEGYSSRRGLPGRSNPSRTGAYTSGILGKRKRSLPDEKVPPKRRKEED